MAVVISLKWRRCLEKHLEKLTGIKGTWDTGGVGLCISKIGSASTSSPQFSYSLYLSRSGKSHVTDLIQLEILFDDQ
jgi:hypothetical protein